MAQPPVKVADALRGVGRLFLDTAPVIYFVEGHPTYSPTVDAVFDLIDAGAVQGAVSPITLAECLVEPIRLGSGKLQQDFADLLVAGANTVFVDLTAAIARQAADLRARYNLQLADAFQVAAALATGAGAFLTNDLKLKRVTEVPILVLDELQP